jgi:hypothetical protein
VRGDHGGIFPTTVQRLGFAALWAEKPGGRLCCMGVSIDNTEKRHERNRLKTAPGFHFVSGTSELFRRRVKVALVSNPQFLCDGAFCDR